MNMKNCAIYTRVSTDNQAEKEFSSCEKRKRGQVPLRKRGQVPLNYSQSSFVFEG